jgi:hypothetical protein
MSLLIFLQTIGLFFCSLSAIILPLRIVFPKSEKVPTLPDFLIGSAFTFMLAFGNFLFALQLGGRLFTNPDFIAIITSPL